jgi:transposase
VERRVLAPLRNHTFHALEELNDALRPLLDTLNQEFSRSMGSSRRQLFDTLDRPALRPLPLHPFGEGTWSRARVNIDYHIVCDYHRYSVPYQNIGRTVDVRLTDATVEVFLNSVRIASHKRSFVRHGFTTLPEHMPPAHRQTKWRENEFLARAAKHGEHTHRLLAHILVSRPVPEQAYRSCLGILRLGEKHGSGRLEAAAQRALLADLATYRSMAALLKNDVDAEPDPQQSQQKTPLLHDNLRGPDYYRQSGAHTPATPSAQEDPSHA